MKQIVVYADQGVDGTALKHTIRSLQEACPNAPIGRIDSKAVRGKDWEHETSLFVVPGGRDIYYHAALDGEGTSRIRKFVEAGGSYLGLCAGAYFACQSIEFEKGGSFEVCDQRSLCFFPGIAEGPAYGNGKYRTDSPQGAEAAHLSWKENSHFYAYFNGGCRFNNPENHPNTTVLSSYLDLEGAPAATVLCHVGKGKALLSGAHIEYSAARVFRDNPYIERILPLLEQGEVRRRQAFHEMLHLLDIAFCCEGSK